jgi:CheY-like chemotaxis protein
MSMQPLSVDDPTTTQLTSPGLCVLAVEDDEADAYLIRRALADNPMVGKVVHACDGLEALAMVNNGLVKPDLAFIDLRMPRLDGFELLVAFADRPREGFPMVVLTSSASPGDAIRSRLRSATRVITKPTTITELYTVLKDAIEAICPVAGAPLQTRPGHSPEYLLMGRESQGLRRATANEDGWP